MIKIRCGCLKNKKPEADDWPLDIQGHDGEWYKVYAQPGRYDFTV